MEFDFDINDLFGSEITVLNKHLNPYRTTPEYIRNHRKQICTVIDQMGVASAKAQGLHGPITSAPRMSVSDQILYVMKDPYAHDGKGAVVGFLKVGVKKLFVYDAEGVQHEIEPLCCLDFYVHESRQRNGCGKQIFDHMLQVEGVKPQHIAIDRPSHKFLSFLMKHFHLRNSLPQRNNFVIFDGFLKSSRPRNRNPDYNNLPAHPYQRNESKPIQQTSSIPNSGRQSSHFYREEVTPDCSSPPSPPSPSQDLKRRTSVCSILCWQGPEEQQSSEELSGAVASKVSLADEDSGTAKMSSKFIPSECDDSHLLSGQETAHMHLPPIDSVRSNPPSNNSAPSSLINSPKRQPADHFKHSSPPSIRRDGPSNDYISLYGPRNHNPRGLPLQPRGSIPPSDPFSTRSYKPQGIPTSWNVMGVPQTRIAQQVPTTHNSKHSPEQQRSRYRCYKQW